MNHSTGRPTDADRQRFGLIYNHGCICCHLRNLGRSLCQINHHLGGGRRLGHRFTTGECPWHHVGEPPPGLDVRQARDLYGPSRKLEPRAFHAEFGSDAYLLALQDEAIGWVDQPQRRARAYVRSPKVLPR